MDSNLLLIVTTLVLLAEIPCEEFKRCEKHQYPTSVKDPFSTDLCSPNKSSYLNNNDYFQLKTF